MKPTAPQIKDSSCNGERIPTEMEVSDWQSLLGETENSGNNSGKMVLVHRPSPRSPEADDLWHYTNSAGIIGILQSQKLWATSLDSLNDSMELDQGIEIIHRVMSEIDKSMYYSTGEKNYLRHLVENVSDARQESSLYVFCASLKNDSLSQWRAYGGSIGYSICLSRKSSFSVHGPVTVPVTDAPGGPNYAILPSWGEVIYDEEAQGDLVGKALDFCLRTVHPDTAAGKPMDRAQARNIVSQVRYMISILAYCKHPSFREEEEVRLLADAPTSSVKFRSGEYGITPYVELCQRYDLEKIRIHDHEDWSTSTDESSLKLNKVLIGPNHNSTLAARSVKLLVNTLGKGEIEVDQSAAPLR